MARAAGRARRSRTSPARQESPASRTGPPTSPARRVPKTRLCGHARGGGRGGLSPGWPIVGGMLPAIPAGGRGDAAPGRIGAGPSSTPGIGASTGPLVDAHATPRAQSSREQVGARSSTSAHADAGDRSSSGSARLPAIAVFVLAGRRHRAGGVVNDASRVSASAVALRTLVPTPAASWPITARSPRQARSAAAFGRERLPSRRQQRRQPPGGSSGAAAPAPSRVRTVAAPGSGADRAIVPAVARGGPVSRRIRCRARPGPPGSIGPVQGSTQRNRFRG